MAPFSFPVSRNNSVEAVNSFNEATSCRNEQLCRYITRPAIANERLKLNSAGVVVLQLKSPYKEGTTHLVMSPPEFMQRLAALVSRPRLNLIRFHGALAPNAKIRSLITPGRPVIDNDSAVDPHRASHHCAAGRMSWA